VAPFPGLLTVTPAIAGRAQTKRHTNALSFPTDIPISPAERICLRGGRISSEFYGILGRHLLRLNQKSM
jgi:hypothetical protein